MKKGFLLVPLLVITCLTVSYSQTLYLGEPPFIYGTTDRVVSIDRSDSCHTLDFEGITDTATISLGSFYEPWGYYFSDNALVIVQSEAGGSGNFEFNPSGVAILFWQTGDSTILNIPGGFTTGFSFYYSANYTASVEVYSGINGTGSLLTTMPLIETPPPAGYTYWYSTWVPIGVSFEDTARSIVFSGVADRVGFDNITFCDSIPTPSDSCTHQVVPDNYSVCASEEVRVCLDICEGYVAYFGIGCSVFDTVEYGTYHNDTCLFISPMCATSGSLFLAIWDSSGLVGGDIDFIEIIPGPEFEIIADPASDPCHDPCFYVWTTTDATNEVFWEWESDSFTGDTLRFCPDSSILYATVTDPTTGCSNTEIAIYQPGHSDYFRDDTICCGDSIWVCAGSPGVDSIQWYIGSDTTDLTPIKLDSTWCFLLTPEIYGLLGVDNFVVAVGLYFEGICEYRDFVSITINCPDFEITGDTLVCPGDTTVLCVEPPDYPHHWWDDGWDTCLTVGPIWEDTTVCVTVCEIEDIRDTIPVDIVFYLDFSGSMYLVIDEIVASIDVFVDNLEASSFDWRLGGVVVSNHGPTPKDFDLLATPPYDLTTDIDAFKDWLSIDRVDFAYEKPLNSLASATTNSYWRRNAQPVIIMFQGEAWHCFNQYLRSYDFSKKGKAISELNSINAITYIIYDSLQMDQCSEPVSHIADYKDIVIPHGKTWEMNAFPANELLDMIAEQLAIVIPGTTFCCVDTCITIRVLDEIDKDTSMCVGDTMLFCCNPICDSLDGSRARPSREVMAYRDGTPAPECIAMDSDSCCMKFVPHDPGTYSVWQPNYYDGIHECCYDVWWHITVCCTPQGSLAVDQPDPTVCEWNVCFNSIDDSCYSCCPDYDSLVWDVTSLTDRPLDVFPADSDSSCIEIITEYSDTIVVCATAFSMCDSNLNCTYNVCETLVCCVCPPCSAEIVIDYPPDFDPLTDTLCLWDSLRACLDCPEMDSINWVNGFSLPIGSGTCITTMFDTLDPMLYPVPGWRKLIAIAFACDDTCYTAIESVFVDSCDVTISGNVTSICSALPIEGVQIYIYDGLGTRVGGDPVTNVSGDFTSGALPSGNYNVIPCLMNYSSIPRPAMRILSTTSITDCDFQMIYVGDWNCNGDVGSDDVWYINRRKMEAPPFDPNRFEDVVCDPNCNHDIGSNDVWYINKLKMDSEYELPIPCIPSP